LLEVAGHKIEVADNGEIAFEKYRRRQLARTAYDVVLVSYSADGFLNRRADDQMDVSMPVMGGMESTGLIRKYESVENIPRTPIIALTAHAMIGDKERCLEAGVSIQHPQSLAHGLIDRWTNT
jgi:osomolarity two-component system sensor histidine kinase NIK1